MRLVLKAVASIGLSSVVMMLLSMLRMKILAVELGAGGVGVLGILTTTVVLASTALGGGLGASGVRAVAAAGEVDVRRRSIHVAVARGSTLLALFAAGLAGLGWWLWGRAVVAELPASMVAPWVAVSVGASIGVAGTSALLNGQGRIGALAACNALGSVTGTVVFLLTMRLSDESGMIAAFVAVPVATLVIGTALARSTYPRGARVSRAEWAPQLGAMLKLGLAVSGSVVLTAATQVVARVWVSRELGIDSAGYLQGCLAIGSAYLGFVLTALAAEYYPRISALHGDRESSNRAANDQMRIVLALGGPLIVGMIAVAPWLLSLLYNQEFESAQTLLRLLLLGDVFKLVGWCVGFLMLAREAKGKFFAAEMGWNLVFLAILMPLAHRGVTVAGIAYLVSYLLYAALSLALARHETGFAFSAKSRRATLWLFLAAGVAFSAAESGTDAGLAVAFIVALVCAVVAASRLLAWTRSDDVGQAAHHLALASSPTLGSCRVTSHRPSDGSETLAASRGGSHHVHRSAGDRGRRGGLLGAEPDPQLPSE
ncbi:MAG: oligosaccharide flippase family protein [Nocardioides sp.]